MAPLRRSKRDSAENIYRHCKPFGTCPPDVVNKIENTTPADRILQYGSGVVYFGGLGIGTGKGTGGRFGYTNLGNRPAGRPAVPFGRFRPTVPAVETIPDVAVTNVVDAGSDSIVPLIDGSTESSEVNVLEEGGNLLWDQVLQIPSLLK